MCQMSAQNTYLKLGVSVGQTTWRKQRKKMSITSVSANHFSGPPDRNSVWIEDSRKLCSILGMLIAYKG